MNSTRTARRMKLTRSPRSSRSLNLTRSPRSPRSEICNLSFVNNDDHLRFVNNPEHLLLPLFAAEYAASRFLSLLAVQTSAPDTK